MNIVERGDAGPELPTPAEVVAAFAPSPLSLDDLRAGMLWRGYGVAYVVESLSLQESADQKGIYQLDGTPVSGKIRPTGPLEAWITFVRADWLDGVPCDRTFDPWIAEGNLHLAGQSWYRGSWEAYNAMPPSQVRISLIRQAHMDEVAR